jgi:hypothetical protein
MSQTSLSYMDVDLTIDYDFEPEEPATRDEPGCAAEATINSICVGEVDITHLIESGHKECIARRVADAHDEDSASEHADYLIKQMKEAGL